MYGIARSQLIPISQKADSQVQQTPKYIKNSHKVATRALGQLIEVLLGEGQQCRVPRVFCFCSTSFLADAQIHRLTRSWVMMNILP